MATNIVPAILTSDTVSMTSREIAELTGKRHDHVLRDIDTLVGTLPPDLGSGFKSGTYESGDPPRPYRQFILDRDSTYCLVAGYDAVARMRIIKRWQDLEARTAKHAIPQTYGQALQLAADQAFQLEKQALLIEAAKPAVEFFDRVGDSGDAHTIDQTAKILRTGPKKLRQWMKDNGVFRQDGLPYQSLLDRGYFRVIEKTIDIGGGAFKLHPQTFVTGKGVQFLQRRIDHALMGVDV